MRNLGCAAGQHRRAKVSTADSAHDRHLKEATPVGYKTACTCRPAQPSDGIGRGPWSQIFGDPQLSALEDELTVSNQNLKIEEARFRQARAMIGCQRTAEFPTISVGSTTSSLQDSSHPPYFLIQSPPPEGELQLAFDLNYEIDLWGRTRRTVAAALEEAQATDADPETVSLSLHAELAPDYIELLSADPQLDDTVKGLHGRATPYSELFGGRGGPRVERSEAQTQPDTTRVQDTDVGVMRAQYEHAIATLIGKPPAAFSRPPSPLDARPPSTPPGIPSELLQRRPDIAAAERRLAEVNEQIGIAKAAYYPSLNFSALSGFLSSSAATWFSWPSLFSAVGTSLTQELFDGGRRHAQSEIAWAGYDAPVASYRHTTLTAFQQVGG